MPAGRPTKYSEDILKTARKLALLGLTDKQMCDICGVCESTWNVWKEKYPEFMESLKEGREIADAKVAESLYHRANGYSHPEEKIMIVDGAIERVMTVKHYAPDTTAGIFWLKNRQPDKFRDKRDVTVEVKSLEDILEESQQEDEDLSEDSVWPLPPGVRRQ